MNAFVRSEEKDASWPAGEAAPAPGRASLIVRAPLALFQVVFLLFWTSFWITAALIVMVVTLGRDVPLAMARRFWGPGILRVAGARVSVEGGEGIDWSKPHVFAANHQSQMDIPVCFVALRANLRFVAKRSLAYMPFIGWYMAATGMVFVDRGNTKRAVESLRRAAERIRDGVSILAYPEGTRSRDGSIGPFKKGTILLARQAGVPVVPVAVLGARDVLPIGAVVPRPAAVRVRIGMPIPTDDPDQDPDELVQRVRAEVVALHAALVEGAAKAVPKDVEGR